MLDEPAVVVIEGGTIVAIGTTAPGGGSEVTDLGDVTLMPGLVDAHQHLVFNCVGTLEEQVVGYSDQELLDRARANAGKALRAGITTIRDLGDANFVTLALRDDPSLPTILAGGPPLTAEGGHCWYLGGCCADTAALVEAVRERKRRGCDVVKIMVTGGSLTPTFPMWESQFTAEQVAAVVVESHALGLPVAAHCHGIEGTMSAAAAGVDTIEHCSFFTDHGSEFNQALIEQVVSCGAAVSATMGMLPDHALPPTFAANIGTVIDIVRHLRERGVTVVAGTDAGISPAKPHDVLPYAAKHLAMIGMSNLEILTALTATAARVIGIGDRKGRLAPGYDADLLAVGGDPGASPDALLDVRGVWRGGVAVAL